MLLLTNGVGEVTTNTYNSSNLLTSISRPSGLVTTNFYNAQNRIEKTIDLQIGRTNCYTYENGLVKYHTNELGLVVAYRHDNLQRVTELAFPDASTISNRYDKLDLIATKDRLGNWTQFLFDSVRQKTRETNRLNRVTQYSYCDCGVIESITDALDNTTWFYWDDASRQTGVRYADNSWVTNRYNLLDQLVSVEDSFGTKTTNYYHNQGLLAAVSNQFGLVRFLEYDVYDRVTNSVDANGVTLVSSYDSLGRVRTVTHANDSVEKYGYSAGVSGPTAYTNQVTNIVFYAYDAAGRRTNEILGATPASLGGLATNSFNFDAVGNLLTLTDGNRHTTTWHYDAYSRLIRKQDHLGNNMSTNAYNANGWLTARWTPAKGLTTYAQDAEGNLTSVDYPASTDLSFAYDALNRLTNMVDSAGQTGYGFDSVGRLSFENGPWLNDTVSYGYSSGLRMSLTVAQPESAPWVESYAYDAMKRLTNVTSPAGAFGYEYPATASSLETYLRLPNGAYISKSYSNGTAWVGATLLKNSSHTVLNGHEYHYWVDGSVKRMVRSWDGSQVDYTYDALGQLEAAKGEEDGGATRSHEQFTYAYDAAGNLTTRHSDLLEQKFTNNVLNQLTSIGRTANSKLTVAGTTTMPATNVTVNDLAADLYADRTFSRTNFTITNGTNTFTAIAWDAKGRVDTNAISVYLPAAVNLAYDENGNLISDGQKGFEYDDENQLVRVTATNLWKSEFVYDAKLRRRVRKEYAWQGGAWVQTNEVRYVYDGNLVVQEREYRPDLTLNTPQRVFCYTRGRDLSGTREGAGGIGGLLSLSVAQLPTFTPQHFYYHAERLGNVTALVGANQVLSARYVYDPYGRELVATGPAGELNRYRFSTKEWDGLSSLYYFLYRFYAPDWQRWISRDPISDLGHAVALPDASKRSRSVHNAQTHEPNTYAFLANAPPRHADPLGLRLWLCTRNSGTGKTKYGFGRHVYIWDDREMDEYDDQERPDFNRSCGMGGSSGNGSVRSERDTGPLSNYKGDRWSESEYICNAIPNSEGKEDKVKQCCTDPKKINRGPYFPFLNDCHNRAINCLKYAGIGPGDIPPHSRLPGIDAK